MYGSLTAPGVGPGPGSRCCRRPASTDRRRSSGRRTGPARHAPTAAQGRVRPARPDVLEIVLGHCGQWQLMPTPGQLHQPVRQTQLAGDPPGVFQPGISPSKRRLQPLAQRGDVLVLRPPCWGRCGWRPSRPAAGHARGWPSAVSSAWFRQPRRRPTTSTTGGGHGDAPGRPGLGVGQGHAPSRPHLPPPPRRPPPTRARLRAAIGHDIVRRPARAAARWGERA